MARIRVPQADGQIQIFDGADRHIYHVNDNEIDVADSHVGFVLAGVSGSALIPSPEPPAPKTKSGTPTKEQK